MISVLERNKLRACVTELTAIHENFRFIKRFSMKFLENIDKLFPLGRIRFVYSPESIRSFQVVKKYKMLHPNWNFVQ